MLNEVYVQTSMEYYALASLVGVQLDSQPAETEQVSSRHSSGVLSQRALLSARITAMVDFEAQKKNLEYEKKKTEQEKA